MGLWIKLRSALALTLVGAPGRGIASGMEAKPSAAETAPREGPAREIGVALSPEERARLMDPWHTLQPWPDAERAVRRLRAAGVRLGFRSNITEPMLRGGLERGGLGKDLEAVLSTDAIRTYKPDPRAYQLAIERFGRPREEILFVAFAGWDAAGAKWFGFPTFWLNRAGAPAGELGVRPDASGSNLGDLADYVIGAGDARRE